MRTEMRTVPLFHAAILTALFILLPILAMAVGDAMVLVVAQRAKTLGGLLARLAAKAAAYACGQLSKHRARSAVAPPSRPFGLRDYAADILGVHCSLPAPHGVSEPG